MPISPLVGRCLAQETTKTKTRTYCFVCDSVGLIQTLYVNEEVEVQVGVEVGVGSAVNQHIDDLSVVWSTPTM